MAQPLQFGAAAMTAVVLVIAAMTATESDGRELRPSDHGLVYSPPEDSPAPAEAKSFFAGGGGGGNDVALPKAMNSSGSDTSWWRGGEAAREGGSKGRDHVRDVLVVVSLVCGATGVVLFVATAFVYLLRYRSHKKSTPSPCS